MPAEEALQFLKQTPPFSLLAEDVLRDIARETLLDFHQRGAVILRQGGPAAAHLHLVRTGAVKVFIRTNEGEEVLVDYRTRGEFFGLLSFAAGDVSRDTVTAVEDTSCYLVRKETVLQIMRTYAEFAKHCFRSRLKRLTDQTYGEIRDRTLLYGGGDKLLFTNVLADLVARPVVTAPEDSTIREAAAIMAEKGISSLVLVDREGRPAGMLTDRDLRSKVLAKGRDPNGRVGDIMSVTIIKSDARDYCFEALLKMIRYNIHHLLVVDKGELTGIVTGHDLMLLQGTSPLTVSREIEAQDTIDGLAPAARKIHQVVNVLAREGAKAAHITRIITEINDRLVRKVLGIVEARLGPPPVAYCWIAFGSEGRKEQTFRTDQDNAIICEERTGGDTAADAYFAELGERMRDALSRCGFPPCPADYMASNSKWRKTLDAWKRTFSDWIQTPGPEEVLRSLIFFDFRPVHGDTLLAEKLRSFLALRIKENRRFLGHMAGTVLRNRPPLGLFGRFTTERTGADRHTFDIKVGGLCPVIDLARLFALEEGVYQTSTLARLEELRNRGGTAGSYAGDLEQAFEFLMSLRLRHQFQLLGEGRQPDNRIEPDVLGVMERRQLKETFRIVLSAQDAARKRYADLMVL